MSFIKEKELILQDILKELNYDTEVRVLPSSKKELGDFQINIAMNLAKKYHKNPMVIASEITNKMQDYFANVNIAAPGFINFSFKEEELLDFFNNGINDFEKLYDKHLEKTIFLDYGGANAAKALHVGHMRSANIGEALRRLCKRLGYKTISDVHLGDLGRQAGMLISEIKKREPNLAFFDENYKGEYPKVHYTASDLGEMYVKANIAASESDERMEEIRNITALIDKGDEKLLALWKQLVEISSVEIKKVYDELNCHFDLWEGELNSFNDIPSMLEYMKPFLYESNGAMVMDVKLETDTKEMPPLIVIKKDGATIYATRDLASIYSRVERFNPDEIWYVVDSRQSLYFEQVFRASQIAGLVKDNKLLHLGFGTINGRDGKPYKTRDGGVMYLSNLIDIIKSEIEPKIKNDIKDEKRDEIKEKLTIATLKYSDLMSNRTTDYIFDEVKFSSFDGKTGPYILYTDVRLKSILKKAGDKDFKLEVINNDDLKNILLKVLELPSTLNHSFNDKSLNYITDYLFDISSLFNKFYNTYHILTESDSKIKNTYLATCKLILNIIENLLNILAIDTVDRM
ncbi:MAG: arginine--tRNA ligase [Bacilli bacterium]|nr:arginine--tRNA ligase [Bacilli bacterium]